MDQPNLSGGLHLKRSLVFPTRQCSLVFPKSIVYAPHMAYKEIPKAKSDSRIRQNNIYVILLNSPLLQNQNVEKLAQRIQKGNLERGNGNDLFLVLRHQVWKDRARAQR